MSNEQYEGLLFRVIELEEKTGDLKKENEALITKVKELEARIQQLETRSQQRGLQLKPMSFQGTGR